MGARCLGDEFIPLAKKEISTLINLPQNWAFPQTQWVK
jgi:hypothetical protein